MEVIKLKDILKEKYVCSVRSNSRLLKEERYLAFDIPKLDEWRWRMSLWKFMRIHGHEFFSPMQDESENTNIFELVYYYNETNLKKILKLIKAQLIITNISDPILKPNKIARGILFKTEAHKMLFLIKNPIYIKNEN